MLFKLIYDAFRHRLLWPVCMLLCFSAPARAQYFDIAGSKKRVDIPFLLKRNLIVIKLSINNKGPYNFVLDSGVGIMLITDSALMDSIKIPNKRMLKMPGLGTGKDAEAYATPPLNVHIPGLVSHEVSAAILKKDVFSLSAYAGMPIHGLLGYDFFNSLAVRINFQDSIITTCRPKDLKIFRKGTRIPIIIEDKKAYLSARVVPADHAPLNTKLIVDLGAGHAVSLEHYLKQYGMPEKFIASANLGIGLNGPITGFIGRLDELDLGKFKLKRVLASFPDDENNQNNLAVKRDGNLGLDILMRFAIILDYANGAMYLKPNSKIKEPFEHDMSGIEYYAAGNNYDRIIVSRVEPGSAGDDIGLEKDDEIVAINLIPVSKLSLQQIDELFKSKDDRSLLLEVYHEKRLDRVVLTLKRRI